MAEDTLAKMFWSRVESDPNQPAQQWKADGTWKTITRRELGEAVREVALGLIVLGREKGDVVAILSASSWPTWPTTRGPRPSSSRMPPSWPRLWRSATR